jgi:hypothetical protein
MEVKEKRTVSINKVGWVYEDDPLDLIQQDMSLDKYRLLALIGSTMWDRKKDAENPKNWLTMDADHPRDPMKAKKIRVRVDVTVEEV